MGSIGVSHTASETKDRVLGLFFFLIFWHYMFVFQMFAACD